MKDTAPHQV